MLGNVDKTSSDNTYSHDSFLSKRLFHFIHTMTVWMIAWPDTIHYFYQHLVVPSTCESHMSCRPGGTCALWEGVSLPNAGHKLPEQQ